MTKMADSLELRVGDRCFFYEFRRVLSLYGNIIHQPIRDELFCNLWLRHSQYRQLQARKSWFCVSCRRKISSRHFLEAKKWLSRLSMALTIYDLCIEMYQYPKLITIRVVCDLTTNHNYTFSIEKFRLLLPGEEVWWSRNWPRKYGENAHSIGRSIVF